MIVSVLASTDSAMGNDPPSSEDRFGAAPVLDSLDFELTQRRVFAQMLGTEPEAVKVGRFVLEERLGSGGMGTVWRAFDEQLDRAIALKFLHSDRRDELAERRMLEEAQALAKVSHPNVIPVYDVGRHDGRVWIAMELIPGRSLRAWMQEVEPGPSARLAAWLDVGRGLAAVHELGLVHRDVKPDNVMMGDDGRVRLIDFGLVRAIDRETTEVASINPTTTSGEGLTATGQFVGTRRYAAPEQLAGRALDARADQYAFCVCVWESLTGAMPDRALLESRSRALPRSVAMPRRVHRALLRGLALAPAQRFANMQALLDALAPRRRRWLVPTALVVGASGLAIGVTAPWLQADVGQDDPCAEATAALSTVLDEQDRARWLARFDLEGQTLAAAMLDDWSERWRDAATRSCADVHIQHLRSEASLDRRRGCLGERLVELEVALEVVEQAANPSAAVIHAFAALGEPELCLDEALLRGEAAPPDAETLAAAAALRRRLFEIKVGAHEPELAGRVAEAEQLEREAEALELPELQATAVHVRAGLDYLSGEVEAANEGYGRLLDLADTLERDDLRVKAWHGLAQVSLHLDRDVERAQWQVARELRGARKTTTRQLGLAQISQARLFDARSELGRARSEYEAALETLRRVGPTTSVFQVRCLHALALIAAEQGRSEDARALRAEAATLERGGLEGAIGETEGLRAFDEGWELFVSGRLAEAEASFLAAREAYAAEAAESLDLAECDAALAGVYDALGQSEAARLHARAADRWFREHRVDHPFRFGPLSALGSVEFRAGNWQASADAFELALLILERQRDPDPIELALARANLAEAWNALGRHASAQAQLEQAIAVIEATSGVDDPFLAIPRKALGAALLGRGRASEATVVLTRALAQFEAGVDNPVEEAEARWLLGLALAGEGQSSAALDHARAAALAYEGFEGPRHQTRAREIRAWMSEQQ